MGSIKFILCNYSRNHGYRDRYQARKALASTSAIPVRQKSKKRAPAAPHQSMPIFAAPMMQPMAMMYPAVQEEEEESEEDEMVSGRKPMACTCVYAADCVSL